MYRWCSGRARRFRGPLHWPPSRRLPRPATVTFELREALDGHITPATTAAQLADIDGSRAHALCGPVAVRGARPGEVLEVELLDFAHHGWGWTGWYPGLGLLADDFPEPHLQHWRLEGRACLLPSTTG